MSRAFMLTAWAVVLSGTISHAGIASEQRAHAPSRALVAEVSDRELFEMCCWAKGRAGFNHCEQYGICVDHPEKQCVGRGPAEGMALSCGSPSASSLGDEVLPSAEKHFFLLARR